MPDQAENAFLICALYAVIKSCLFYVRKTLIIDVNTLLAINLIEFSNNETIATIWQPLW